MGAKVIQTRPTPIGVTRDRLSQEEVESVEISS